MPSGVSRGEPGGSVYVSDRVVSWQEVRVLGLAQPGDQLVLLRDQRAPVGHSGLGFDPIKARRNARMVHGLRGADQSL